MLEYTRDFGNAMHESLKRTTNWAAYYFTHPQSYYPVSENKIALHDISKMKQLPVEVMPHEQIVMREWAQEHGKAVRQLTIRQTNTKHAAGTLPLHMHQKELPVGERITTQSTILDSSSNNDEQQSEYDSASDEDEELPTSEVETTQTPVNFLSRTIRTRSGRAITLSHRALTTYQTEVNNIKTTVRVYV